MVIVDIDADGAKRKATAIEAEAPVIGDASDSSFCDRAVKLTLERHGWLDMLVNCAGIIHRANAEGTSDQDWRRVMAVNVDGVFYISRAAMNP